MTYSFTFLSPENCFLIFQSISQSVGSLMIYIVWITTHRITGNNVSCNSTNSTFNKEMYFVRICFPFYNDIKLTTELIMYQRISSNLLIVIISQFPSTTKSVCYTCKTPVSLGTLRTLWPLWLLRLVQMSNQRKCCRCHGRCYLRWLFLKECVTFVTLNISSISSSTLFEVGKG